MYVTGYNCVLSRRTITDATEPVPDRWTIMHSEKITRRGFLATTLALSAGSLARVYGANERLRVAAIGTGGKGKSDLQSVAASPAVDVVALCDIDSSENHLGWAVKQYPKAKVYRDWRRLLDEHKDFDAVIVATPDHMHAPISLPALALRKHVYCEKPLTHTVFEARQMQKAAERAGVVTQMGNQIQSHEAYRTATRMVHDGLVGRVKEVHSWQSGKLGWILVDDRPKDSDPVPDHVRWEEWLGVAPTRPYKAQLYHSFNWRAWQDFSNGQLGDFGCHILDPVFTSLNLTAPLTVQGESSPMNSEVWYRWSVVRYVFPGTARTTGKTLPVTWYDGEGRMPSLQTLGLAPGTMLPGSGSLLIGEKGSLLIPHVQNPQLFVEGKRAQVNFEKVPSVNHYTGWADACRGVGKSTSHFGYAGPLTEAVLLGTVAIRVPGQNLQWDAKKLSITNSRAAQQLLTKTYRKGWEPSWVE